MREKKNKDVSERTARVSDRTLKKCVVPVAIHDPWVWIEKKWQSWCSVVSDGAKTFFFPEKRKKKTCFHSGVVGTTCHVVLGFHLLLCHFNV